MLYERDRYRESDMRPLIQVPTWDGKLVLAGLFILGYYSLVLIMAWRPLPTTNAGLIRDAMLTLGPVVGLIFGSLFRNTAAEERRDALRSSEVRAAIEAPGTAAPMTGPQSHDIADAVERGTSAGLSGAEPVKVEVRPNGTLAPLAADGERRDWLDEPIPSSPPNVGGTPVMGD
jgi:hypothetical protein